MPLRYATIEEAKEVYSIVSQYKDIFPHVRYDYINRKINANRCILDSGVTMTFTIYRRAQQVGIDNRRHRIRAEKGDIMIHQVASKNAGDGNAKIVFEKFLKQDFKGRRIWLQVRQDNERAIKFYEKIGMQRAGTVFWMNGNLAGYTYVYDESRLM